MRFLNCLGYKFTSIQHNLSYTGPIDVSNYDISKILQKLILPLQKWSIYYSHKRKNIKSIFLNVIKMVSNVLAMLTLVCMVSCSSQERLWNYSFRQIYSSALHADSTGLKSAGNWKPTKSWAIYETRWLMYPGNLNISAKYSSLFSGRPAIRPARFKGWNKYLNKKIFTFLYTGTAVICSMNWATNRCFDCVSMNMLQ